jgi:Tat protein secretion system quality control protein TatD with DNase activity
MNVDTACVAAVLHDETICVPRTSQACVPPETYAPVFYAAGTHPMSVVDEPMATDGPVKMAAHPKRRTGETGLDYHTADSAELQKKSLRIHIAAASGKPSCRLSSIHVPPMTTWRTLTTNMPMAPLAVSHCCIVC